MSPFVLIALAADDMQRLLGAEPKLARAFARLQKRATATKLRKFCGEGVSYTERRVRRLKSALRALGLPSRPEASSALPGLIADAVEATRVRLPEARDAAILAAIEPISHYGLALYASIDRYLLAAGAKKARAILEPSRAEKLEAIEEMAGMMPRLLKILPKEKPRATKRRKKK